MTARFSRLVVLTGCWTLLSWCPAHAGDVTFSKEYDRCIAASGGVTASINECTAAETDRWDKRLNAGYKSLLATLNPERKKALVDAEVAWLLGLQVFVARARKREEIEPAIAELQAAKVEAVQFLASSFLHSQRAWFIERLRVLKLPAMYEWPESVDEGGLVSYAPRLSLCYRHVAVLVSRVLHGTKPADLPIEQPVTFTLAVNTGTARAIGLTLPESMLLRADVVVD